MKYKCYLDIQGIPESKESIYLSDSHGYYAYCSSGNEFFNQLLKEMSIWSGSTDCYRTADGYFNQYELDCRDRAFLKSETFKKICRKSDVELIVCEDDMTPLRNFFDSIIRR